MISPSIPNYVLRESFSPLLLFSQIFYWYILPILSFCSISHPFLCHPLWPCRPPSTPISISFSSFSAPEADPCNQSQLVTSTEVEVLRLTNWWSFVEVWDQQSWRKINDRARNYFHYTGILLPGLRINPWLSLCCRRTERKRRFTLVWNLNWTCPLFYSKMMAYQRAWPSNLLKSPCSTCQFGRHHKCDEEEVEGVQTQHLSGTISQKSWGVKEMVYFLRDAPVLSSLGRYWC